MTTSTTLPRYGRRASSNRATSITDPKIRPSKSTDEFDEAPSTADGETSIPRAAKSEQNLLNRSVRSRRPARRRSDFPLDGDGGDKTKGGGGRMRVPRGSVAVGMTTTTAGQEEEAVSSPTPKPKSV